MEKRTREILALVLLLVLGLGISCAMAWYMLAGHSWNQAATRIDDMVGSMEGYTVVVFDGVAKKQKPDKSSGSARLAEGSGSGSGDSSARKSKQARKSKLDAESVAASYREKGAGVIVVRPDYENQFADPVIAKRCGKRVGLFAFEGKYRYRYAAFREPLRYLEAHEVDRIVAFGTDKALLKGNLSGVDVLVLMRDAGIPASGEMRGQTFCVDSPRVGEVQAVIIAPSGVMSSQTVKEL